jgi:micrococcal nuclease
MVVLWLTASAALFISAPLAGQSLPPGTQYVASSRGEVYYWVQCAAWRSLSIKNLRFFKTRSEAQRAGYRPSRSEGCAGPPSDANAAPAPRRADSGSPCQIEHITDGDTVRCGDGRRIRLLLIDAPELSQRPWGTRARDAVARLAPVGTRVTVERDVQPTDRYGRTLAYLYLPDGRMLNETLAAEGFVVASVYPPNVQHVERIRAAVARARSARRGLWATPAFSCSPADHRAGRC